MTISNRTSLTCAQNVETHKIASSKGHALTLVTLCMAVLIVQLDTTVVNLVMSPIGQYFHAAISSLQWVVDGYNLVYTAFLLTSGLLADLLGRRKIFMAGAGLLTLASVACAWSPNVFVLVVARMVAGFSAALILPASLALIRVIWQNDKERARALGIWAGCNGLALAIGPTLGGLLAVYLGWRSVFLMTVPLGVAAVVAAALYVPESADPGDRSFDVPGQILGALALGALAFAAIESYHQPVLSAIAGVVFVLSLGLFLRVEGRLPLAALVPLDLFRMRPFVAVMITTASMTFGMYGVLFLLPLAWQQSGIMNTAQAGIALMPMALAFVVVSFFSGTLAQRLGAKIMGGGVAVIGSGLVTIAVTTGFHHLAGAEIGLTLTGVGMGLATGPLMGAAVEAVPAARSGSASALINVARMVGATLGVAILGAIFAVFNEGGFLGLRVALLLGGGLQLAAAALSLRTCYGANQ